MKKWNFILATIITRKYGSCHCQNHIKISKLSPSPWLHFGVENYFGNGRCSLQFAFHNIRNVLHMGHYNMSQGTFKIQDIYFVFCVITYKLVVQNLHNVSCTEDVQNIVFILKLSTNTGYPVVPSF